MSTADSLHATCVAWDDRAVLIIGASGVGKSGLALTLMAFGCTLVADDRVSLQLREEAVYARCPGKITGLIEARGLGILKAEHVPDAQVVLAVDMDQRETERLPQRRYLSLLDCNLPLIYRVDAPHFASGIMQILKAGWSDR